jgi:hypothetical protein
MRNVFALIVGTTTAVAACSAVSSSATSFLTATVQSNHRSAAHLLDGEGSGKRPPAQLADGEGSGKRPPVQLADGEGSGKRPVLQLA